MKISKMYTELSMKSQTYHQDLPSTIGITKQVHTADTIDASLHHDLSHQHSQGSRSKNTAVVGTTSTTSTAEYSIAVLYNTNDHCDGCIDITEVTGNRLYHHGIARSKKLTERCARESNIKQEQLHPILRKNIDEHYASDLESRAYSTVSKAQSVAAIQCSRRLYSLSKSKQDEGKRRREAIALASLKRNQVPNIDFGVLPADKAGDAYLRGVSQIEQREDYLEWCRAEIEKKILKCHEFKLAEGAFAQNPDAAFQAKVYQCRYGKMLQLDRKRRELVSKSDSNQVETRDGPPSVSSVGIGEDAFSISSSLSKRSIPTPSQRRKNDQYDYSPRGLLVVKEEQISRHVDSNVADTFTKLFARRRDSALSHTSVIA